MIRRGSMRSVGVAIAVLTLGGLGAVDSQHPPQKKPRPECKTLPHGSAHATLDRTIIARPDSPNKILKGTLKWSGEVGAGFEGLFVGVWDTTQTPWGGKASWSQPAGQEGFTAQLDVGDTGGPLFVTGRHLVSLLDEGCKAQAHYLFKIHPEAATRLIKAKTVTIRITGLTESSNEPVSVSGVQSAP